MDKHSNVNPQQPVSLLVLFLGKMIKKRAHLCGHIQDSLVLSSV